MRDAVDLIKPRRAEIDPSATEEEIKSVKKYILRRKYKFLAAAFAALIVYGYTYTVSMPDVSLLSRILVTAVKIVALITIYVSFASALQYDDILDKDKEKGKKLESQANI